MLKFQINFLFIIILFIFSLNAGIVDEILTKKNPDDAFSNFIRIGVVVDVPEILVEGDAKIFSKKVEVGSIQSKIIIMAKGKNAIKVGNATYFSTHLHFEPKFSFMSVKNRIFRGVLDIYNINGKLTVVNDLKLEDYVKGVINKEILPSWPLEAKKVQAVLARTYAVYQKMFNPRSKLFDLAPTVLDQVYGGLEKEDLSANKAVDETKGEILTYHNLPAQIFFHSTCGGRTASAKEVWGKDIPYLKSVKCNYCKKSPLYRWKRIATKSFLIKKFRKAGYKFSKIEKITVLNGVTRVKFVVLNGKKFPVNDFRKIVGYSFIWSNAFVVKKNGNKIIFKGKGAGHGVGVCQWGAAQMAKNGKKYKEILGYYLKNIKIKRIY